MKPPADQVNVVVRFPVDLHHQAKTAAEANDLTLSQLIRRATKDAIAKLNKPPPEAA